ncbi:MAG: hypothetical protein KAS32_21955 [Candidatus Peribacteraceae bacterium]|nr:hypothetical protein [Candidatus Peribacteraceae bacterium]
MNVEGYKINRITFHYLTDSCDGTHSNPCLNVFYKGKRNKRMVAMINPLWSDIRFLTEKEYHSSAYKQGFIVGDLGDIQTEARESVYVGNPIREI